MTPYEKYEHDINCAKTKIAEIVQSENMIAAVMNEIDMNKLDDGNIEDFERELETDTYIGWSYKFAERMKQVPIAEWICTDTMVGYYAYFFDKEFVAISSQLTRKSYTYFVWVSKEKANEIQDYIIYLNTDKKVLGNLTTFSESKEIIKKQLGFKI
jgi:hypothetical protein